ncbi:TNF_2 domain-containing protein [Caenorhabditis elegans]|uniref:TNF_2 domain-containing protein n=1 Tax=Caenorhabditis elegans TaxID=6239 RepID=Q9N486_CAEEL|nr:TNF_2 domain-containing protein [Caenorhabditis elegans]CCD72229.1 TNF_2 domain-containing protein [Caenorhabditis elegans]|eukprot:NP_500656.1 Uncharacterized protein CELE_Y17G9A.2 [Caenorhabditis elegans]
MQQNRRLDDSSCPSQTLVVLTLLSLFLCAFTAFGSAFLLYQLMDSTSCKDPRLPLKMDYVWPGNVQKIIDYVIENDMHVTNNDRTFIIRTELMRFKTTDEFYIIVYDHTPESNNHAFYGNKDQYIVSINPGKSNVVVYRSRFWKSSQDSAYNKVMREVDALKENGIQFETDYSHLPKQLSRNFTDSNFIGIISNDLNPKVRGANNWARYWGPGYFEEIPVFDGTTKQEKGSKITVVVGYK